MAAEPKEKLVLADTDVASVFLGKNYEPDKEYAQHSRVQWISASGGRALDEIMREVSEHVRVVLLTEGIPAVIYQHITNWARKRGLIYLHRRNERALRAQLRALVPPDAKVPASLMTARHGDIQKLLTEHPPDLTKPAAEEARRLFGVAKSLGITTTHGSLAQAISVRKRKAGVGERPASARAPNPQADALQVLDDAIAGLQLMRDWVEATAKENQDLRATTARMKELLGMP